MFKLEMRSTQDRSDVRWRSFTRSRRRAEAFRRIPMLRFTDSGHGIVPVVAEVRGRGRERDVRVLRDHVSKHWSWYGR